MTDVAARPEGHSDRAMRSVAVTELVRSAIAEYRSELGALSFLPETRYDRRVFATYGQYDWFSGQVLYCLVRVLRPTKIVEFSTSSGYSTSFTALALRANGAGMVHSVDIDAMAQRSARAWLERRGLLDHVELHLGDCREVVPSLLGGVNLLFIDSLHSFDLTVWYLEQAIPRLAADTLVHVHDIMPPEARVRIHGGPPYPPSAPPSRPPLSHLVKRAIWLALQLRNPNPFPARRPAELLPLETLTVYPPGSPGEFPTIDGNYFEEAVLLRELLRDVPEEELCYLHREMEGHPELEPQKYAHLDRIQRQDRCGRALEWNDTLWCRASALQSIVVRSRIRQALREARRRYGSRA